jgi:nucleotide-binding universal stress UspA family protein
MDPRERTAERARPTSESIESIHPGRDPEPGPPSDEQEPARKVVVGIDGSDESATALRWAVGYARRIDAVVRAVAVWHQPLQFGMAAVPPPPRQAFEAEAGHWLTAALPSLRPDEAGAPIQTRTAEGDPSSILVEQAADAEVLVLGNHGRGAVSSALVGSVAQRCVQRCGCPVVLVPRSAEQPS